MVHRNWLMAFACLFGLQSGVLVAADFGAPDLVPSPEQPVGWRGDGTGRYPAAEPPIVWGRNSKVIGALSAQAAKPKNDAPGKPIAEGVFREWLVLGPVTIPDGKKATDLFADGEDQFAPNVGDKRGELEWKLVTTESAYLHLQPLVNKPLAEAKNFVAYAHTWIHSPVAKAVHMNLQLSSQGRGWLNGKPVGDDYHAAGNRVILQLSRGWNGLLIRVGPAADTNFSKGVVQWHLGAALFGADAADYEDNNIAWVAPLPDLGPGVSSPIVVGDRIFLTSELCDLVCMRKTDGKILWMKSNTFADVATEEERKAQPEVFKEIEVLTTQMNTAITEICTAPEKAESVKRSKVDLQKKINILMTKVDAAKYAGHSGCEAGESANTPCSDGTHVYALFGSSVVACYDLDGKRIWAAFTNTRVAEHGHASSPLILDGKLFIKSGKNFGVLALDCKSGATLWSTPAFSGNTGNMNASPVKFALGNDQLVVTSCGTLLSPADGKVLIQDLRARTGGFDIPSAVTERNTVCSYIWGKEFARGTHYLAFQVFDKIADPLVPASVKICAFDLKAYPTFWSYDMLASPLLHDKLAYCLSMDGVLTVIDAPSATVVYQKMLELSSVMRHSGPMGGPARGGCCASPTLGGKYIYLWDNQGTTLVIEPGRSYKLVARNRIEQIKMMYGKPARQEVTSSCPVFHGKHIYYRGESNLYCIGPKF